MTWEQVVFATIVATLGTVASSIVLVVASRRFGLPGIARSVATEQGNLITTLQGSVDDLERKNNGLQAQVNDVETRRAACEQEIRRVKLELRDTKRDLRDTEAELLELYRKTGKRPPQRLTDHAGNGDA
jgi:septal ring factor EnvC (AmiA/AmiB activator)